MRLSVLEEKLPLLCELACSRLLHDENILSYVEVTDDKPTSRLERMFLENKLRWSARPSVMLSSGSAQMSGIRPPKEVVRIYSQWLLITEFGVVVTM